MINGRTSIWRYFTHLAETLCRIPNIPARYVLARLSALGGLLARELTDFAAWTEVLHVRSWCMYDLRNNHPRVDRALIARSQDAFDVAMISTFGGPRLFSMTAWADEVQNVG